MTGTEYLEDLRGKVCVKNLMRQNAVEIRARLFNIAAPPLDAEKVSGGQISGIDKKLSKLEEYETKILARADELETLFNQAHDLIYQIDDEETATVLWGYYGNGWSDADIAKIENLERQSVRNRRKKGLQAFNEIYNKTHQAIAKYAKM